MTNSSEIKERRSAPDRRNCPTPFASRHTFRGGQRRTVRRGTDRKKHLFVDLYSTKLWIALLTVTLLSLIDAYLTLTLIEMKIVAEANPVMAFYLGYGDNHFIVVKFLVTSVALFFLCLTQDFVVSKIALAIAIVFYLCVIIYEVQILYAFQSGLS